MSKKLIFKLIIGLSAVVAAVLWLLSIVVKDTFGWFSLSWAVVIFAGATGVAYILKGIFFKENSTPLKKLSIYLGGGFILIAILAVINALALSNNIIMPIILIVVAAALLLGMLVVGGKKWDQGDNQNVGYKTYRQRKEEEDKANKK